ncbi:hypothetical protein [Nitrosomonas communis]|uniref:Uncharacterized protein n=1 Tax=Nitrosomonas communis TaxID=44574 RepID=A0A1H2WWS5_9PROT|nr:hypothetical protein [Nitrosomonas communis]SDW84429.1 hypothetical protein SAMN05421882_10322 [Nitrosomonas communis]
MSLIRNGGRRDTARPTRGRQWRENLSRGGEVAFLAPFIEKASAGGILIVNEIMQALDTRLQRKTSLAATYNLLHRHGWRKLLLTNAAPKQTCSLRMRGKNFAIPS